MTDELNNLVDNLDEALANGEVEIEGDETPITQPGSDWPVPEGNEWRAGQYVYYGSTYQGESVWHLQVFASGGGCNRKYGLSINVLDINQKAWPQQAELGRVWSLADSHKQYVPVWMRMGDDGVEIVSAALGVPMMTVPLSLVSTEFTNIFVEGKRIEPGWLHNEPIVNEYDSDDDWDDDDSDW